MQQIQSGPLADTMPYTSQSAEMCGSSFTGSSEQMLIDLAGVIQESFEGG